MSHLAGLEFSDLTRPFEQRECYSPDSVGQCSIFEDINRINEVALLLLDYGANASAVDNDGNTAFDFGIHYGCRSIISELSSREPSSNIASATITESKYGVRPPGMSFEEQWFESGFRQEASKSSLALISSREYQQVQRTRLHFWQALSELATEQ